MISEHTAACYFGVILPVFYAFAFVLLGCEGSEGGAGGSLMLHTCSANSNGATEITQSHTATSPRVIFWMHHLWAVDRVYIASLVLELK
jgi:hypothetical protein